MSNKKVILALDQSSRTSGWSIFDGNELIDFGHWTFTASDISIRIHSLCEQIEKKLEEHDIDFVIIENIQQEHNQGVDTFQKLAWVQGAIMELCQSMNVPFTLMYPSEWRSKCNFLKGNDKTRATQKKIAQDWVFKTFNLKCTEDEADAICIGYGYLQQSMSDLDFDS